MKKVGKKKWIVAAAVLVALAAAVIAGMYTGGVEAEAVEADIGLVQKLIKETGTIESDNTIIVASNFSGEIKGVMAAEGDSVSEGELLITGDESVAQLDLKSLRAQLSGLEVSHARARDMAQKNKTLYEQGALSREAYDGAVAAERELAAQVSSLRYSIESYAKASGSSGVASPIKGTITEVYVQKGQYTTVGASLFEIADLDDLYVKVNLVAEDADLIREGDKVLIYGREREAPPMGDSTIRRVHLKVREELSGLGLLQRRVTVEIHGNPDLDFRLGSEVDLAIIAEEKANVLRVPAEAVFRMDGNSFVFIAEGGKAHLRQVETGLEGDDHIEINSGLAEGESVILSPGNDIEDGVKLK